ncbi:hypothetical protein B4W72_01775 [Staphylococcus delphini]|uniref:Uncharacterized protein n=1 Tax=Staphylococcus delphini TaxID=53344 RepID=A0A2A4H154_9STAP|nr:hypothetical protein B5C08_00460 [Staphylococcus delphini]PCF62617.1 hypothetical protein B5C01_03630 [Staphylococcus delphini]PCF75560.1 hypothetical protein B4W72_01775 [Staphylococcus delphini]
MEAELDFPGQLIPRESQPSGQSYIKNSETEVKFMKSKTIASILFYLIRHHFPTALKLLMNHQSMKRLRFKFFMSHPHPLA